MPGLNFELCGNGYEYLGICDYCTFKNTFAKKKEKTMTLFILTSCGVVCRRLRGMNVFNFGMNEAYVLVPNS